jgi:hypothetical protein
VSIAPVLLLFVRDWALTVLLEGLVLWFALSREHAPRVRLLAAVWLSSCTLPLVQFVFPLLEHFGWPRSVWVALAEVFAPVAECLLFRELIKRAPSGGPRASWRDYGAIIAANLCSFAVGERLVSLGWR